MKLFQLMIMQTLLIGFSVGISVECDFRQVKFHDKFDDMYTCVSVDLETFDDDNHITEVSGNHTDGKSNKDVQQIRIVDQTVPYFPGGLSSHFKNLEAINVKNSSLKYIYKADLLGLSKLKYFAASGNEIELLGPNLFEDNSELVEIHFENNKIAKISEDLLDPLENLTVVHFYNNECVKVDLEMPKYKLKDLKEMIKEKCPLTTEDVNEVFDKQLEKLVSQVKTLEDAFDDEKSGKQPIIITADEDLKQSAKLQMKIEKLESEKEHLEIIAELANQTLEANIIEIQNLTEKYQSFKLSNEYLQTNLTKTLDELNSTHVAKESLEAQVSSMKENLATEKLTTKILQNLISTQADKASELKLNNKILTEKLDAVAAEKEAQIAKLKNDLEKALKAKDEAEKKSEIDIKLLKSVNLELRRNSTIDGANKSSYDNLIRRENAQKKN